MKIFGKDGKILSEADKKVEVGIIAKTKASIAKEKETKTKTKIKIKTKDTVESKKK